MKWISAATRNVGVNAQFVYFSDCLDLPEDPALEGIEQNEAEGYEALSLLSISREISDKPIYCTVTADSGYVLWVNGQFVATGKFTDPFAGTLFDRPEITNALVPGKNQILFLVSATKNDTANIAFEIHTEDTVLLESSTDTKYAYGAQYHESDLLFDYDALDSMQLDWQNSSEIDEIQRIQYRTKNSIEILPRCDVRVCAQGIYINADHQPVSPAVHMKRAFIASQDIEQMSEDGFRFTVPSDAPSDGMYIILDLGAEETGYFDLEIEANPNTEMQIAFGEHLDDLRVRTEESKSMWTAKYICRGDRTEHFTYYKTPVTCRYIQLFVADKTFVLYYAGLLPCRYGEDPVGCFTCSDVMHRMIYQTAMRNTALCMQEDIPSKISSIPMLDLRNQLLCIYYTYGAYDYAKTWLRLLARRQRSDGLLDKRSTEKNGLLLPEESLIWILSVYEYVLYSGDLDFAAEIFPVAERMLRTFWMTSRGQDVLSSWSGKEYTRLYAVEADTPVGPDAPLTLFYILALRSATQLAKWLNKNRKDGDETDYREASSWYDMLAESAKETFHKTFWCEEAGMYADYIANGQPVRFSEFTQALALCVETVPETISEVLLALLSEEVPAKVPVCPVNSQELLYKYEALLAAQDGINRVLDAMQKRFGSMLLKGATTFWDDPEGKIGSRCGYSGAIPIIIYNKYILGAVPTLPGFADFAFHPFAGGMQCSGRIPRINRGPLQITVSPEGFEVR